MCARRYMFNRWGTCLGKIDESGAYFDAEGRQVARVVDGREVYGCDGRYRGRIDEIGQYWNERGNFLGYLGPTVREKTRATPS